MRASYFKTALFAAFLATSASAAQASVITFENMVSPGSSQQWIPTTSHIPLVGYEMKATGQAYVDDSAYYAPNGSNGSYASNGTDYLRLASNSSATLTSTVQKLFSVQSIDLANWYFSSAVVTATLTGTFANGQTISTTYSFNNNNSASVNDFTTEQLSGFTNLTSFKIGVTGYVLDVDNIVVTQGPTAVGNVPEPASLAILGLGLAGIAAVRRRKLA
jgi:hypothetical protein